MVKIHLAYVFQYSFVKASKYLITTIILLQPYFASLIII